MEEDFEDYIEENGLGDEKLVEKEKVENRFFKSLKFKSEKGGVAVGK